MCAWRLTSRSFLDGLQQMSNYYCLPGRAGGSPSTLVATVVLVFIRPDRVEHALPSLPPSGTELRMVFIAWNGTIRHALPMELDKALNQFSDEVPKLPSRSSAELRELKAYQCLRPDCSDLSSHMEGHLVDAEEQFHNLVHGERMGLSDSIRHPPMLKLIILPG